MKELTLNDAYWKAGWQLQVTAAESDLIPNGLRIYTNREFDGEPFDINENEAIQLRDSLNKRYPICS